MVAICTISPKVKKKNLRSSHRVFMCFLCISEQTVIKSVWNINWLICMIETECDSLEQFWADSCTGNTDSKKSTDCIQISHLTKRKHEIALGNNKK
jgi:hypothetical protein